MLIFSMRSFDITEPAPTNDDSRRYLPTKEEFLLPLSHREQAIHKRVGEELEATKPVYEYSMWFERPDGSKVEFRFNRKPDGNMIVASFSEGGVRETIITHNLVDDEEGMQIFTDNFTKGLKYKQIDKPQ